MSNNLKGQRKAIRKLIGILNQEDGEAAFRALMNRLPVTIDEAQMKTPQEFVTDLRENLLEIEVDHAIALCDKRYGSIGLKRVRDKAKARLSELGIDPEAP